MKIRFTSHKVNDRGEAILSANDGSGRFQVRLTPAVVAKLSGGPDPTEAEASAALSRHLLKVLLSAQRTYDLRSPQWVRADGLELDRHQL